MLRKMWGWDEVKIRNKTKNPRQRFDEGDADAFER